MFRTEVTCKPSQNKIGLQTPILSIGSCFADNIGNYFKNNKFAINANPFGTVYNPISIFQLLELAINDNDINENDIVFNQGLYAHYLFHSSFSSENKELLISQVKKAISFTHQTIKKASWLIVTFGTAYVYQRKDTQQIVANCHKVPSQQFTKSLLTNESISNGFTQVVDALLKLNPKLKILITLSPVRHIKDTLELNQVSKSILRSSIHEIVTKHSHVEYFPSYEIMLDDLRDYRFYKSDMLHPSALAEEYIWKKLKDAYFDDTTIDFIQKWEKLKRSVNHRPFNPNTKEHQKFLNKTLSQLESLSHIADLSEEIITIKNQII